MRQVGFKQNKPFGLFLPSGFAGGGYEPVAQTNAKGRLYDGVNDFGIADSLADQMYVEDGEWTLILGLQQFDPGGAERIFTIGTNIATNLPAYQIRTATTTADLKLQIFNSTITVFDLTIAAGIFDGAAHFLVLVETVSGGTATVKASVDGAALSTIGTYTRFSWTPDYATIGALRYDSGPTVLNPYSGVYSDVAWLSKALTNAEIAQLHTDWAAYTLDLQADSGAYTADLDALVLNTWQGEATDTADEDVNQTKGNGTISYSGSPTLVDWPYTWPNNYSVSYDGSTEQSISAAFGSGLNPSPGYYFMTWLRITTSAINGRLFTVGSSISGGTNDYFYVWRKSTTHVGFRYVRNGSISNGADVAWPDDNAWHNVIVSATTTGGFTIYLRVDGVSIDSTINLADDGSPGDCTVALASSHTGTSECPVDIYKAGLHEGTLPESLGDYATNKDLDWSTLDHYWPCGVVEEGDDATSLKDKGAVGGVPLLNTLITTADFIAATPP